MPSKQLQDLVERVVADMPLEDRTFPRIQNELMVEAGEIQLVHEALQEDDLYELLEDIAGEYGLQLFTPELIQHMELESMSRRQIEVMGSSMQHLPIFWEKVKNKKSQATLLDIAERGFVYHVRVGRKRYVVKPIQGEEEPEIAQVASDIGVGPEVVEVTPEWIAEEYVEGVPLYKSGITKHPAVPWLAKVFGTLHRNGIAYIDDFSDSRGHFIFNPKGPKLIDYGVASRRRSTEYDLEHVEVYLETDTLYEQFKEVYQQVLKEENKPKEKNKIIAGLKSLFRL